MSTNNFSPEEKVIAENLGVPVAKPKAKIDRKKVRAMREAIKNGAVSTKSDKSLVVPGNEIADTIEKNRYEQTLARTSIFNERSQGVPGVQNVTVAGEDELKAAQNKRAAKKRKREIIKGKGYALSKGRAKGKAPPKVYSPIKDPESSEFKNKAKEELENSLTGGPGSTTARVAEAMHSMGDEYKPLIVDNLGDLDIIGANHISTSSASQESITRALTHQKTKEINKLLKQADRPPLFSDDTRAKSPTLAAAASLRALSGGEAPTFSQASDITPEEYNSYFEEVSKNKIHAATGKPLEDIEIPGNETYTDSSGKQTSINAEALRAAQRDHDTATRTQQSVNGIKPTDPRPERFEDIATTPHQARAYVKRFLPVTDEDMDQAPGVSRANFDVKTNALLELAKDKHQSSRKIDIKNEIQQGVHKGYIDPTTGKKVDYIFDSNTKKVLNAPEDFTRTARPIAAIDTGDTTENLMGADEFHTEGGQENTPVSAPSIRTGSKRSSAQQRIGNRIPGIVESHEGWVPNEEGYHVKITHPIPEADRVHVADVTVGKVLGFIENKEEAKKSRKPNTGVGIIQDVKNASQNASEEKKIKMMYPLGRTPVTSYDTDVANDIDVSQSRNPQPPRTGGGKAKVLVKNQGLIPSDEEINEAVESNHITGEDAADFYPQWHQRQAIKANSPLTESREQNLNNETSEDKSYASMTPKERRAFNESKRAMIQEVGKKAARKSNRAKPAKYYNKFVDVSPYGVSKEQEDAGIERPLSAAYIKAANAVKNDRHTIPYEHPDTMLEQKTHPTMGPVLVRTGNPLKGTTTHIQVDERGPVTEEEVMTKMIADEKARQSIPDDKDIQHALNIGAIPAEEAKDLGTLDQFSEYRPVNTKTGTPRAGDVPFTSTAQMKYARLYEPTTAAPPKVENTRVGVSADELNSETQKNIVEMANGRNNSGLGAGIPVIDRPRRTSKVENPVSETMRPYYGVYEDTDKMENKAPRYNKAYEGSGRQFSNIAAQDTIVQHRASIGQVVNHEQHGLGRVVGVIPQGQPIPGTGEKHKNGRIKKGTETLADVDHLSISFGDKGVKHIPSSENVSQLARERVNAAIDNPITMARAGRSGTTASYLADNQNFRPKLEIMPDIDPEKFRA